jgi:hypothetical protein
MFPRPAPQWPHCAIPVFMASPLFVGEGMLANIDPIDFMKNLQKLPAVPA